MDLADGDGRYLINLMESVFDLCRPDDVLDTEALLKIVQQRAPVYDKDREGHYNLISALHKSLARFGHGRGPVLGPPACSRAGRTLSTCCAA